MLIGHARVGFNGRSLETQTDALKTAGCEKIYSEKGSARTTRDRSQLERAPDQVRCGDTLVVTRLDRLARSVTDLHRILERIMAEGVALLSLQQGSTNTETITGKLTLAILGAVAKFENDIRRDRQREGSIK